MQLCTHGLIKLSKTGELYALAQSIVQYAERATTAEAQVLDLESRLEALEMANQTPPPHMGYFAPQTAYGMMPVGPPPPATINVPPTYHNTHQQTGGKRNYADNDRSGQRRRPNSYRGNRNGGGDRRDQRNTNNTQKAFSNAIKHNLNLLYCFLCGYDVDHDGYN